MFRWFHGFLASAEVQHLLYDKPEGTYLIRFSNSQPDSFALAFVDDKLSIRTVLILREDDAYTIKESEERTARFESIQEIIDVYGHVLKQHLNSKVIKKP